MADRVANAEPNPIEVKRAAEATRQTRERQRRALELQRERVLSERTSNPGRRAALQAALESIESQIAALAA